MQKFLDSAEDGVIYLSFGSLLQGSKMPKQFIQAFLGEPSNSCIHFYLKPVMHFSHHTITDSFKNLSQRVLWKFEDKSLTDIPSNVMIRDWMPQNDILAHPNVILFISHGGMLGAMESLYHGVSNCQYQ